MADTPITINPNRVSPLSEQEYASTGFNSSFDILAADIAYGTGASDTVTVTLGATPAKWYIDKGGYNISTAFAGITAATVVVGTTTTTNAVIASTSILTQAWVPQAAGVPFSTNLTFTAAKNLVAVFTAAGTGGPAALTGGVSTIYLNVKDATQLP